MAQQALQGAQARLDHLQRQYDEAFMAYEANPSNDLKKERYTELKLSLHKAEDFVNSLATAAGAAAASGRLDAAFVEERSAPSKRAKTDSDQTWVSHVLGQIPDSVSMDQVKEFLADQVFPIPCSMDVMSTLTERFPEWRGKVEVTGLFLDGYFGTFIYQGFNPKGSEQMTVVASEAFIGNTLDILSSHAPRGPLYMHLDHDRDSSITNTSSASYGVACRPDSYFVVNERLLLVGEDKASHAGLKAATDDLRQKSISLAQSHYGPLQYILAYAAAGYDCEIHLINTDGEVISPGIYFDLNHMQHRAALLATVINIYRLLLSLRNQLPALHNLMPDNIWVPRPDHRTEIMHVPAKQGHGGRFHKRAETSVYDHILQQLGSSREENLELCCLGTVANSLVGCVTSCTRMKVVHVMPALGPDLERSPPQSEQEFRSAARCIAKALFTLHSNDGAHHDVRAANVCWQHNSRRAEAVLVDLSTLGPVNTRPLVSLKDWIPQGVHMPCTLSTVGTYTQHSDMHQMGIMLSKLSTGTPWEGSSIAFCQALQNKQLTASQVMAHPYVSVGT